MSELIAQPHNVEAEQAVLGSVMLISGCEDADERLARLFGVLKPESFYQRPHRVIYERMRLLHHRQQPLDLITLTEDFEQAGELDQLGGFAYLAQLSKDTPSAANVYAYAAIVRDKAVERFALTQLTKATELIYSQSSLTTQQKLDGIASLMTAVSDRAKTGGRSGLRSLADCAETWVQEFEERIKPDGVNRGLSTGIGSLDDLLGVKKIVRGSLFVIGARPKMGKTSILTQFGNNCAAAEDEPALLFSLEMPEGQMLEKLIAQQGRVDPNVFYPDMTKDDYGYRGDWNSDLAKANGVLGGLIETGNIYIDATPGVTLAHICAESRRIKRERGKVGMVLVDYLTLMTPEKADRNDLAYGIITKALKNLAKELDCVVVLLTQLNRGLESRADKRPFPSDSRDTGQIEQDCDYWLGLHNEGKYDPNLPQDEIELLLRLNRHGDGGVVYARQVNGIILDVNQEDAARDRAARAEKPKKGGGLRKYAD